MNGDFTKPAKTTLVALIAGLLITLLSGYIGYRLKDLDRIVVQVAVNTERIARLEAIVSDLPATLARQSTMLNNIDKKLDRHMESGIDRHMDSNR